MTWSDLRASLAKLYWNLRRKQLEFHYRNQSDTECCCGGTVGCNMGTCNATCRSMKEYVITSQIEREKNK